jgi:uncharacterized protein YoxC
MNIIEMCIFIITIAVIVLTTYSVKTLINLNRTLNNVHGITESVYKKTITLDKFFEQLKEIDGIAKYAKIGFDVVKSIKKK